uniref:Uncharacterized protein n=1 Tax=Mus spicilegus TaxID=10103 RepID=A0A8C6GAH7_MUSSI
MNITRKRSRPMLKREGRDIINAKRSVLIPRAARTSLRIRPIRAKRTILKSVGGKTLLFSKPETKVPREGEPVNSWTLLHCVKDEVKSDVTAHNL